MCFECGVDDADPVLFTASKTVSNFLPPPMQLGSVEPEQSKVFVPFMRPVSSVGGAPSFAVLYNWAAGI